MHNKKQSSIGGVSFLGLLFIAFLVLKLTHVIDWSWWWISCPLWFPLLVVVGLLVALGTYDILDKSK